MEFFIGRTSRPYQGDWMSYAKSFIKDFPVPESALRQGGGRGNPAASESVHKRRKPGWARGRFGNDLLGAGDGVRGGAPLLGRRRAYST